MSFRITGLPVELFRPFFGLSDDALRAAGVTRCFADSKPGFPDRVELRDAEPGEKLLLLNYTHQPAATPYRASHAIFVLDGARQTYDRVGEVPEVMRRRVISVRAFDEGHLIVDADLVEGTALETLVSKLFHNPEVSYLQAHYAKRGCFAARIDRA